MPHIHTGPGQHDFTVSAYIVRVDGDEPKMLLNMHRKLHQWLHFGGHVELHENLWQALIHEVREESGYELSQLRLLQPDIRATKTDDGIIHPWPVSISTHQFTDMEHFHTDIGYAFTARQDPKHTVTDGESRQFRTFTASELRALRDAEIPANVRDRALIILEDYIKNWQQIPVPA